MKKLFVLSCTLIALSAPLFASWELVQQKPKPIPGVVWGMGQSFQYGGYLFLSCPNNGLKRSTDNGVHWSSSFEDTIIDYAKGFNALFILDGLMNLCISQDSGGSWRKMSQLLSDTNLMNPHFLAKSWTLLGGNQKALFAKEIKADLKGGTTFLQLMRSLDTGKTWQVVKVDSLSTLDVSIDNTNLWIAGKPSSIPYINNTRKYFISNDNGNTWQETGSDTILQNERFETIVLKNDIQIKKISGRPLIRSIDLGKTWDSIAPGKTITYGGITYTYYGFDFPKVIYIRKDLGSFTYSMLEGVTSDTGKSFTTWFLINTQFDNKLQIDNVTRQNGNWYYHNPETAQLFIWNVLQGSWMNISADLVATPIIFILPGTKYIYGNFGSQFYSIQSNGNLALLPDSFFDPKIKNYISSGICNVSIPTPWATYISAYGDYRKTTDSGLTWQTCLLSYPSYKETGIYIHSINIYGSSFYTNGYRGVYKCDNDNGVPWVLCSMPRENESFHDLLMLEGHWYATADVWSDTGASGQFLEGHRYASSDSGKTWKILETSYDYYHHYNAPVYASNAVDGVYYGWSTDPLHGYNDKIIASFDTGATWFVVRDFGDTPTTPALATSKHSIFLLIQDKLTVSSDSGKTWKDITDELINIIYIATGSDYITVTTADGAQYRKPVESYETRVETTSNLQSVFCYISAYPNPFTPSTVLSYQALADGKVQLYDIAGKMVWQTQVKKGSGQVLWKGVNMNNRPVSAGIYIVRLQSDNRQVERRVVLTR